MSTSGLQYPKITTRAFASLTLSVEDSLRSVTPLGFAVPTSIAFTDVSASGAYGSIASQASFASITA